MWQPRPVKPSRAVTRQPVIVVPPVGIRGETSLRVFNPDGSPGLGEIRYPDGHVRRIHELAPRHNLILNGGLDDWCQLSSLFGLIPTVPSGYLGDVGLYMRSFLRVGTGSVAPAVTDTALNSQVQASDNTFGTGLASSVTAVSPTLLRYSSTSSKRITLSADRNLTEYGFSRLVGSNPLVRELFRDELDTPISISILNGKIIQVDHTLNIDIPRSGQAATLNINSFDVGNNLIGTVAYDMEVGFFRNSVAALSNQPGLVSQAVSPGLATGGSGSSPRAGVAYALAGTFSMPLDMTGSDTSWQAGINSYGYTEHNFSVSAYTLGTFRRTRSFGWPDTYANGAIRGVAVGHYGQATSGIPQYPQGWVFKFIDPSSFTKLATNTLTVAFEHGLARV
jgi:hypothetical protein